ncbi:MAG: DUF2237 family protein [Burkholderiaceae bacterium]|jgi:uncharacterized protein (DUF2237 family)
MRSFAACLATLLFSACAGPGGGASAASVSSASVSAAPTAASLAPSGADDCPTGRCALPDPDPGTAQRNVAGEPLAPCGSTLRTGFYRDGRCTTGPDDHGVHVVCAEVTERFLSFTAGQGNDLSTPRGAFPGLREGDRWCLCASRWAEADAAGVAPPVVLEATHERALDFVTRDALDRHAR